MFLLEKCLFFEITEYVVNNTIFSSKDEKIICLFEKPKTLKTKF